MKAKSKIILLICIVFLCSYVAYFISHSYFMREAQGLQPISQQSNSLQNKKKYTLVFPDKTLNLEVANTEKTQVLGLSYRSSLSINSGMLFVFPAPYQWGIWMKDMYFPLDILWLDQDYKIIYMKKDATPDSYPRIFTPKKEALYVIEVNVGFIDQNKLQIGQQLTILKR